MLRLRLWWGLGAVYDSLGLGWFRLRLGKLAGRFRLRFRCGLGLGFV